MTKEYIEDSRTCVHKSIAVCGVAIVTGVGICMLVAASPIIAMYKGAIWLETKISHALDERKHTKLMKSDWGYRLANTAPRISALRRWEDYMHTTQWKRAQIQIEEAGDIPYEVWLDLMEHDHSKWRPRAQLVGLDEYDDIKDVCVREALTFYSQKDRVFTTKCE